jgi:hypothetical protein
MPSAYSGAGKPLAAFIRELVKQKNASYISVQREGFSLVLRRNSAYKL